MLSIRRDGFYLLQRTFDKSGKESVYYPAPSLSRRRDDPIMCGSMFFILGTGRLRRTGPSNHTPHLTSRNESRYLAGQVQFTKLGIFGAFGAFGKMLYIECIYPVVILQSSALYSPSLRCDPIFVYLEVDCIHHNRRMNKSKYRHYVLVLGLKRFHSSLEAHLK